MRSLWVWVLIGGLMGHGSLFAQTHSVDSVSRLESIEKKIFTPYRAKQNWLRVDLLQLVSSMEPHSVAGMLSLAYEQKFKRSWSFTAELQRAYQLRFQPSAPRSQARDQMGMTLGARYYHQMGRRVRTGVQADNLSGNYFAMTLGSRFSSPFISQDPVPQRDAHWYGDNLSIGLLAGVQRQMLRFAFFDVAFGIRVSYGEERFNRFVFRTYVGEGWQVFPVGQVRIGLGC